MGYSVVFWIDERPLRDSGLDWQKPWSSGHQDFAMNVGAALQDLLDQYPHGRCGTWHADLGGYRFLNGVKSFHSTDEVLLEWKGDALVVLDSGHDEPPFPVRLADLRKRSASDVRLPLRGQERANLIRNTISGADSSGSQRERDGIASVYWAYEDWYRDYKRGTSAPTWPLEEMGRAVLNMVMLRTEYSAAIGRHGNAINKAATILANQSIGFIWSQNCLRDVNDPSLLPVSE